MLRTPELSDVERKLMTIMLHNLRRGHTPSLKELEVRSGYTSYEITETLKMLIKKEWLGIDNGEWIVLKKLF